MQRRYLRCSVCQHRWQVLCDKRDADPDCPNCDYAGEQDAAAEAEADSARMREIIDSGRAPAVIGYKAKAIDFAQQMAEQDYGLTNMRDNARPGEAHFMPDAAPSTSEVDARVREVAEAISQTTPHTIDPASPHIAAISGSADPIQTFWGGSNAVQGKAPPAGITAPAIGASAPAAAAARAQGDDPVRKLHDAGKQGLLGPRYEVVAKAKMDANA